MQITRLVIENLRAIERLDLNLADDAGAPRRRLVLLGANGAGKTTVLDAITHAFAHSQGSSYADDAMLGAADVRNVDEPSLSANTPRRRGTVALNVVLSQDERRSGRRIYPKAPAAGPLRFEVGAVSEDILDEDGIPQIGSEGDGAFPVFSDTAVLDVSMDDDKLASSFEGAVRAALSTARDPCILLPADRGVLGPSDDLSLREIRTFDARYGSLSRSRQRFSPIAARLALAALSKESEAARSIARMWKVLKKYFSALPTPLADDDLTLRFRDARGAIVPLTSLSEGERAILLIFGELALRSPSREGLVLVDELEQHLHPRWQRAALAALVALLPSSQFIFTTQSPYLAACAPDDVITLGDWKTDGE